MVTNLQEDPPSQRLEMEYQELENGCDEVKAMACTIPLTQRLPKLHEEKVLKEQVDVE